MFGGLNRLILAALVAGAVLVVLPPAALADGCGGGPSAVNVYSECLGSGGGGKPTAHTRTHSGSSTKGGANTSGGSNPTHVPISPQTTKTLKKAGKDEKSLASLVKGYGAVRLLQSHSNAPSTSPTAIGSAFDLGSGPTVLLIVLAGAAFLLITTTGVRVARSRR